MNRTTWVLLLLLCLIFQPGISGQQPASQESAGDHLRRANELADSRNWRGAIGEFRAAVRLDPSSANAHWGLARALDAESKEEEALKEYQSALKLDLSLASCQLIHTAITAGTSRVAHGPLCLHAVATTPAGRMEFVRS